MLRDRMNVEVISSKFDLIGYACFSPWNCLGQSYRFSIRKGGEAVEMADPSCYPMAKSNGRTRPKSQNIVT